MIRSNSFFYLYSLFISFSILSFNCQTYQEQEDKLPDTRNRGSINISADESFKPVIDEHIQVYESNFQGTHINVQYKPEAECLKDLLIDSIRMIIVTRRPSKEEEDLLGDTKKIELKSRTVARDGIALIVNPEETVSEFTMEDVKSILNGTYKRKLTPVFDGVKATSTVRFIIDSVLQGDSLTPDAMAARSSKGVIDYVAKNKGVIGFIGVSWIGNPEDELQLSFLKKVKVCEIESTDIPGYYVKAYQANIYIKRYPMVRDLTYILKENYKGLGTGFANFMSGEIGQLIFRRAYLAPTNRRLGIRPVKLND